MGGVSSGAGAASSEVVDRILGPFRGLATAVPRFGGMEFTHLATVSHRRRAVSATPRGTLPPRSPSPGAGLRPCLPLPRPLVVAASRTLGHGGIGETSPCLDHSMPRSEAAPRVAGTLVSARAPPGRHALVVVATVILAGVAAFESASALSEDDFGYLMWGQLTRGDWAAWLEGPEWFSYRRPLNALVWWLSGQLDISGTLVRWVQVGLWTTFGAVTVVASSSTWRGAGIALLVLLTNQVFVDLLQWRSWLTTTGGIAFLALSAVAMHQGRSALLVAFLGMMAAGFKEVAALGVACLALGLPGYRSVGVLVGGAVAVGAVFSLHKLGIVFVAENLRFHASTVALFAPLVPVLLATRYPRLPAWALLPTAGLAVAPGVLSAAAVVLSAALFLTTAPRWTPAVFATALVPLAGAAHARQYLLESWALLVLALATRPRVQVPTQAWIAMVLIALPAAGNFEVARSGQRAKFQQQLDFLATFQPAVASRLYHPDVLWYWDLDAIYWVRGGAVLSGQPPPGAAPAQVGPLSGVWADLRFE